MKSKITIKRIFVSMRINLMYSLLFEIYANLCPKLELIMETIYYLYIRQHIRRNLMKITIRETMRKN